METLKRIFYFIFPVCLFLVLGLVMVLSVESTSLHVQLIDFNTGILDIFFKYYTEVGNGLVVCLVIAIVAGLQWRNFFPIFLVGMTSFAVSGIFTQLLKRLVFTENFRPKRLISEDFLHMIEGVNLHESFSFPSGHSTSTFAMFTFLALIFYKNKRTHLFFALLAILGGYSRVYLSQHFLHDVLAGALIGMGITILVYQVFKKFTFKKYFESLTD